MMIEFDIMDMRQGFVDRYYVFQTNYILETVGYGIDSFGTGCGNKFFSSRNSYAEGRGYSD